MILDREDTFLQSFNLIGINMGPPDVSLWVPGRPVTRPSGRPYRSAPTRRIMATKEAQKKEDAKISKAAAWVSLLEYRDRIQRVVRENWKAAPINRPCLTMIEFVFDSPVKRIARDRGRTLKSTKPDIKNLIFAFEDALNPHCVRDKKRRVVAGFPGLWVDDSLSHTIGYRMYGHSGNEGVSVKVWIL